MLCTVQLWDQVFSFLLAVCVVTEFKKGMNVPQQQDLGSNCSTENYKKPQSCLSVLPPQRTQRRKVLHELVWH